MDEEGLTGLVNIGNTCYMNSIIQCLSNCELFCDYFLSHNFIDHLLYNLKKKNNCNNYNIKHTLSYQIYRLLKELWNDDNLEIEPNSFKKLLGKKTSNLDNSFDNYNQNDSQEVLQVILNIINKELNMPINITSNNLNRKEMDLIKDYSEHELLEFLNKDYNTNIKKIAFINQQKNFEKDYSMIRHNFNGTILSEIICPVTKKIKSNLENFYMIPIHIINYIPKNILDNYLNNYFNDNNTVNDSNTEDNNTDYDNNYYDNTDYVDNSNVSNKNNDGNYEYNDDNNELNDDENEEDFENNDDDEEEFENDSDENEDLDNIFSNIDITNKYYDNENSDSDSDSEEKNIDHYINLEEYIDENNIQEKKEITIDLYNCLGEYFKEEILNDDNKWNSIFCNKYVNPIKKLSIWQLPPILIIQFVKVPDNINNINININFPIENLNMSRYININNLNDKEYLYDLFAVNKFINYGIDSGHYYSFCKSKNNKWYKFDDNNVSEIDISALSSGAYLLFYKLKKL